MSGSGEVELYRCNIYENAGLVRYYVVGEGCVTIPTPSEFLWAEQVREASTRLHAMHIVCSIRV